MISQIPRRASDIADETLHAAQPLIPPLSQLLVKKRSLACYLHSLRSGILAAFERQRGKMPRLH